MTQCPRRKGTGMAGPDRRTAAMVFALIRAGRLRAEARDDPAKLSKADFWSRLAESYAGEICGVR